MRLVTARLFSRFPWQGVLRGMSDSVREDQGCRQGRSPGLPESWLCRKSCGRGWSFLDLRGGIASTTFSGILPPSCLWIQQRPLSHPGINEFKEVCWTCFPSSESSRESSQCSQAPHNDMPFHRQVSHKFTVELRNSYCLMMSCHSTVCPSHTCGDAGVSKPTALPVV